MNINYIFSTVCQSVKTTGDTLILASSPRHFSDIAGNTGGCLTTAYFLSHRDVFHQSSIMKNMPRYDHL